MFKFLIISCFLIVSVGCEILSPISAIVELGIKWKEGEAQKYYATPQDQIYRSLKIVLDDLSIPITNESTDENVISIKAGDDDKFKINVISVRDKVTKLTIRVNFMGDKPYAEMLFRNIDKQKGVEQFTTVAQLNNSLKNQSRKKIFNR